MRSNFINQQFRIVPNPFVIEDASCLCKCPKSYFVEKAKANYRLSALVPHRPDDPGTSFTLSRVERNENPVPDSTDNGTDLSLTPDMSTGTGEFNITGNTFKTVYDPPNFTVTINDITAWTPGVSPIPTVILGTITGFTAAQIGVPVGDPIPNDIAAGQQVGYFDGADIVLMANAQITMLHVSAGVIEVSLSPTAPGELVPADMNFFTNANVQFDFVGGGIFYDYSVKSTPGFPAQGEVTVKLFWSDSAVTVKEESFPGTPDQWNAGQILLSLAADQDPTAEGWPEPVQLVSAVLDGGFSDRMTYRSDKPFIPIGFATLADFDGANPFAYITQTWSYNIAQSIANKIAIQDFLICCMLAAARDPEEVVLDFDTLYTSFFGENWYGYFENAVKQCQYNRFVYSTPGMVQETFTANSTALVALITDLVKGTDVYAMAQYLFNNCDMNLCLPPGLYGIGSDEPYTQAFEDYNTAEGHYPYLVVLQLLP